VKKNGPYSADLKERNLNLQDFYITFKQVAKNERILQIFLFSYLVHNQIWLNLLVNDLNTKFFRKKKTPDIPC
jgi:hypothetical protein